MSQPLLDWKGSTRSEALSVPDIVVLAKSDTGSRDLPYTTRGSQAPHVSEEHVDRLSREQVIDEIIACNPSASADFLCVFSQDRLRLYLARLRSTQRARGRESRWLRPAESPAILAHERML